jgi:hypothetical protein
LDKFVGKARLISDPSFVVADIREGHTHHQASRSRRQWNGRLSCHAKQANINPRVLSKGANVTLQVFKGFLYRENKFVAVKKINVFDKVRRNQLCSETRE